MSDIVIVAATRTAVGKFGGTLAKTAAQEWPRCHVKAIDQRRDQIDQRRQRVGLDRKMHCQLRRHCRL